MSNSKIVLQALIIIVIAVFVSSFGLKSTTGQAIRQIDAEIEVKSASCNWVQDHYEVCSYVTWKGEGFNDKAKILVSGSDVPLNKVQEYKSSPITNCVDAGTHDGRRSVQAYLLDRENKYIDIDSDTLIYCKKDNRDFKTQTKSTSFRAKSINNRGRTQGSYEIRGFDGKPTSCTLEGIFRVDDRLKLGQRTGYCHKASGVFSSFVSPGQQYVITDADEFSWRGLENRQLTDPAPKKVDNYAVYMETCDSSFYGQGRYYVRAYVDRFTEEGLILNWEYFNEDTKPAVDFIFKINCDIAVEKQPSVFPVVEDEAEEVIEFEEIVEEAPIIDEVEPVISTWQRFKNFLRRLFS
jgi:hypothetical protein